MQLNSSGLNAFGLDWFVVLETCGIVQIFLEALLALAGYETAATDLLEIQVFLQNGYPQVLVSDIL